MFMHQTKWQFSGKNRHRLLDNRMSSPHSHRHYGMLIGRILRGALKIRYLVLGGAVGGTVSLNRVRQSHSLTLTCLQKQISVLTEVRRLEGRTAGF